MPEFTVLAGLPVSGSEVLGLFESVGWTAYTQEPKVDPAFQKFAQFR